MRRRRRHLLALELAPGPRTRLREVTATALFVLDALHRTADDALHAAADGLLAHLPG